jgi:hypothetical protein
MVADKAFDPDRSTPTTSNLEQDMGSSTFGNADPTGVGLVMPQHIKINRVGWGRVRVTVAPS